MWSATIHGHTIASELPLSWGVPEVAPGGADVRVEVEAGSAAGDHLGFRIGSFETHGRWVTGSSSHPLGGGEPGQTWQAGISDVGTFAWRRCEPVIRFRHAGNKTASAIVEFWLAHIILPAYFASLGTRTFLHASAVQFDGCAVAFMGESGAGKSTLLDAMVRRGHSMLCDDKLALNKVGGVWQAYAAHPFYRPYRQQETLGACRAQQLQVACALEVVFKLSRHEALSGSRFRPHSGASGFIELMLEHNFGFWQSRQDNFDRLASIVNETHMVSLLIPDQLDRLHTVVDDICDYISGRKAAAVSRLG